MNIILKDLKKHNMTNKILQIYYILYSLSTSPYTQKTPRHNAEASCLELYS